MAKTKSTSERVDTIRIIHQALAEKVSGAIAGLCDFSHPLKRLKSLAALMAIPKVLRPPPSRMESLIQAQDHHLKVAEVIRKSVQEMVPVTKIGSEGLAALQRPGYAINLSRYYQDFHGIRQPDLLQRFQEVNRAFLEGGSRKAKWYRYRSEPSVAMQQTAGIPKRIIRFLEGLSSMKPIGGTSKAVEAAGIDVNTLEDFQRHWNEDYPDDSGGAGPPTSANRALKVGWSIFQSIREASQTPEGLQAAAERLRRKHNSYTLRSYAQTLVGNQKQSHRDLGHLMGQLADVEPLTNRAVTIQTRVSHDTSEHFRLGDYEFSCMAPGAIYPGSAVGYAADPTELFVSHYHAQGEGMIGRTLAHLVERNGQYALVFERPFSNHVHLKPLMEAHIRQMKDAINERAQAKNLPLRALLAGEAKDQGYRVIPAPTPKWYDVAWGTVHGGEEIKTRHDY